MEKDWKIVYSSENPLNSEIIKQMLEENGIHAVVINKRDSSYLAFGEAEVFVSEYDEESALKLISENNNITTDIKND